MAAREIKGHNTGNDDQRHDGRDDRHEQVTLGYCDRLHRRRFADFERIDPDRLGDVLELGEPRSLTARSSRDFTCR